MRAAEAEALASPTRRKASLAPAPLLKTALALCFRTTAQSRERKSLSTMPESQPEAMAWVRARALKVQSAEGPHPSEGSATRGTNARPWLTQSAAVFK